MKQAKIDLFMAALKQLSEEHGIGFQEEQWEAGVTLTDLNTGEEISGCIDLDDFKAKAYNEAPFIPEPPMFGPMTKDQWFMHQVSNSMKQAYMPLIVERLNRPTLAETIESLKGGKIPLHYGRPTLEVGPVNPKDLERAKEVMGFMGYMKNHGYIKTEVVPPLPLPSLEGDLSPGRVERMTKEEFEKKYPRKE